MKFKQLVLREALRLYTGRRFARFVKATRDPRPVYEALWQSTFRAIAGSPHWRGRLQPKLEDNALTDYDTYRPLLQAAYAGTQSPLNGEPILYWALSSGSSGTQKKFPVTAIARQQPIDIHLITMASYFRRFPKFLRTPAFYLATYGPVDRTPAGLDVSYISNYNYRHLPPTVRSFYGTPVEILKDEQTLADWRPLYVLAQDSSAIVAVTPAMVMALLAQIEERSAELYEYLVGKRELPTGLPALRVTPERLRQLAAAGIPGGKVDFSRLWPALAFVGCWTDSVCRLQAKELRAKLGGKVPVVETPYSATECWVTVPLSSTQPGGPIHPGAVIVEFLPAGETDPAKMRKPWELEVGQEYEIYVTNKMGLVRYRMYDILRCTGHYHGVAEISFVRKSSQEISMGVIRVSETELLQAVEGVPELAGMRLFFAPNSTGRSLTLYVASDTPLADSVRTRVDAKLCELNALYAGELKAGGTMEPLQLRVVAPAHSVWQLKHAQSKPYLLRHTALNEVL